MSDLKLVTLLWQLLKVSPVMMLHIIFAQGWRFDAATHGSAFTPASGQVLDTFQLLANSNTLLTTN